MKFLIKVYRVRILIAVCILCSLLLLLYSCKNKYDKQFYGTYEYTDSSRFISSGINLYEDGKYAFYSSTCFVFTRDSGNFILANDSISFRSFQQPSPDSNRQKAGDLSTLKFLYRPGIIFYIRHITPFNWPSFLDTMIIGKKKL